jgi:hypothetical protein
VSAEQKENVTWIDAVDVQKAGDDGQQLLFAGGTPKKQLRS